MGDEYRLKNHPLENCDDYTKNLYIDILCSVASYENSNIEAAYKLIAHIMLSAEMKHPLSEHIKNAMQITPERYSDFFLQCREQELQYIFLIDCLLIICSNGEPNKKQVEFVAELSDVFGLDKRNFQYLVKISQIILLQDSELFFEPYIDSFGLDEKYYFEYITFGFWKLIPDDEIEKITPNCSMKLSSMCYVKQFAEGVLIGFKGILYESYLKSTTINWYGRREAEYNKIILENVKIDNYRSSSSENTREINVGKADEMILRNCSLRTIRTAGAYNRVRVLKLENCVCENVNEYNPWGKDSFMASDIYAVNCTFIGYTSHHYDSIGGIFGGSFNLTNCVFENVQLNGLVGRERVIKNSVFKKCWGLNVPEKQKLIESATKNNCQFVDCT